MEDLMVKRESLVQPLLLDAKAAAKVCNISRAHFLSLHCAGRIPLPIRLGRRVLWRATELSSWIEAGCPARDRWQTLKGGRS